MATPLPIFIAELAASLARLQPAAAKSTATEAERIAARARERVPVRTGALRSSIRASKPGIAGGDVTVTVSAGGQGVDYAAFVEHGTAHMAPQPFMRPAVDSGLAALESELADEVARIAAGR